MSDYPCPICGAKTNDFVQTNSATIKYSDVEICVNRQGMLRVRTYPDGADAGFGLMEIININYCPFCGKRFNDWRLIK